jgi:hypothetical protein
MRTVSSGSGMAGGTPAAALTGSRAQPAAAPFGLVISYGAPGYGGVTAGTGSKRLGWPPTPVTGEYWILKSNGEVAAYNAPWYESLNGAIPAGQSVMAIASQ